MLAIGTGLQDWERRYGEWRAMQAEISLASPDSQSRAEQFTSWRSMASLLKGTEVSATELRGLEDQPDFRGFVSQLIADTVGLTRLDMQANIRTLIQGHFSMAQQAFDKGDYKIYHKYSIPFLSRAWPTAGDEPPKVNVTVSFQNNQSPSFAQKQLDGIPDADIEVLPMEET